VGDIFVNVIDFRVIRMMFILLNHYVFLNAETARYHNNYPFMKYKKNVMIPLYRVYR
jgi:hypothetical protein